MSTVQVTAAARCRAFVLRADMLMSLLRKEREMGITPDPAVDAYLKAPPLNSCLHVIGAMLTCSWLSSLLCRRGIPYVSYSGEAVGEFAWVSFSQPHTFFLRSQTFWWKLSVVSRRA